MTQESENLFENRKKLSSDWFFDIRNKIRDSYEEIEKEYAEKNSIKNVPTFKVQKWNRGDSESDCSKGGGEMSLLNGNVFEKVGVNISTVYGEFNDAFSKEIPGTEENPSFFATGISIVAHPKSPLVPAAHFNTRYIQTTKDWFGGGGDLTPTFLDSSETDQFHSEFKNTCDEFDLGYYPKFKKECDEYFYLKHRKEPRGVGGIFFDYFNTGDFKNDFLFTKRVGLAFYNSYSDIVRKKMFLDWSEEQKKSQLKKRGRYVEFNLLYDRGTRFGLMTNGNIDAILMSMPPSAIWE